MHAHECVHTCACLLCCMYTRAHIWCLLPVHMCMCVSCQKFLPLVARLLTWVWGLHTGFSQEYWTSSPRPAALTGPAHRMRPCESLWLMAVTSSPQVPRREGVGSNERSSCCGQSQGAGGNRSPEERGPALQGEQQAAVWATGQGQAGRAISKITWGGGRAGPEERRGCPCFLLGPLVKLWCTSAIPSSPPPAITKARLTPPR